ncbi:MAG TPA: alpha/beta hydrolase [Gemmatimonadales bacterium]
MTLPLQHVWVSPRAAAPTLLLLHGTGGDEHDLLPLGGQLLPGAGMLSARGNVLENGMPRFFRRLAEGVFDEVDLRERTAELARFVREAANTYHFDPGNVVAVGFSNGANIAASLLLLEPGVLRGAVLFRAMVPLRPSATPDLAGVRVLLSEGSHDPIVPREQGEALARMLEAGGAEVSLVWQAAGHGLVQADLDAASGWLREA